MSIRWDSPGVRDCTTMMLRSGELSGLWPLIVLLTSVLGAPFLLAAFLASRVAPAE